MPGLINFLNTNVKLNFKHVIRYSRRMLLENSSNDSLQFRAFQDNACNFGQ